MRQVLLIFLVLLLYSSAEIYAQGNINNEKLHKIIRESGQAEVTVPYTTRNHVNYLSRNLSVYDLKEKLVYISLSPLTLEWFISQDLDYSIIENKGLKGLFSATSIDQAMEWDTYPTYTQYDSIMKYFSTQYPSLCRLDTIGLSINNRLVLALKISDNASLDEDEPEVFYSSTMHGDETGGFVLMLRFIDYLLKNYSAIPEIKKLVDNLEIWINPLANPDGTYRSGNTITSPVRVNASGADLNRRFPDPMDPSIVVPKENADMIKFMRKHRFVISANFHGGAEVINYPWDRWYSKYHADDSWFLDISRAYADTVHYYSGTGYMTDESNGVTRGAEWYIVYGGRQDFVTWELQGREVTIELDRIKLTPAAQLGLLWLYNRSSLIGYLGNALYGIHGIVRDSLTYDPVRAKVYISGHDKDSSQVYSDTLNGSFVRMLAPGTYSLIFSAEGYKTKVVTDIEVFNYHKTDMIVDLQADLTNIEIPLPGPPKIYPNPGGSIVNFMLPEALTGEISVVITSNSGTILREFNTTNTVGVPINIDVSRLAGGSYIILFRNISTGNKSQGRFIVVK
ncbi:MAG: hypothetical protein A2X05_08675 [Bacteroidetes bacterium GWE2_41_25]|nr:MAG: hypothetical protein A2X05_08675 [Bacteroidetes bacterium GWE2_41_25]